MGEESKEEMIEHAVTQLTYIMGELDRIELPAEYGERCICNNAKLSLEEAVAQLRDRLRDTRYDMTFACAMGCMNESNTRIAMCRSYHDRIYRVVNGILQRCCDDKGYWEVAPLTTAEILGDWKTGE